MFEGYNIVFEQHFYDSSVSFGIDGTRYSIECYDSTHIYLYTDQIIGCMKYGVYQSSDEEIIALLKIHEDGLREIFEGGEYWLRDF
jgi:hypothetical protein